MQADYGFDPAVSADGHFVAYTGSQAGTRGIYRKDLRTGDLEFVAGGDAGAPSISGDYVACLGVSETGAGSDVASIRTTARRVGGD